MIVAIASRKGGVGKTTTAVNLAAALAADGAQVLLVDLDPSAGASLSLGVPRQDLVPGAADLLQIHQEPDFSKLFRRTGVEGLQVMPGSVDLRSAEMELADLKRREKVLARRLEPLRERYDWILLDCPAALGLLTRNALVAADGYLIPAAPHFLALDGVEQMVAAVGRMSYNNLTETRLVGIVLTMIDFRIRTTRAKLDEIRQRFGAKVFGVEIRSNVSLAEAPAFGQTIFEYQPNAIGAAAYRLLADEFVLRCRQLERQKAGERKGAGD